MIEIKPEYLTLTQIMNKEDNKFVLVINQSTMTVYFYDDKGIRINSYTSDVDPFIINAILQGINTNKKLSI